MSKRLQREHGVIVTSRWWNRIRRVERETTNVFTSDLHRGAVESSRKPSSTSSFAQVGLMLLIHSGYDFSDVYWYVSLTIIAHIVHHLYYVLCMYR